MERIVGQSFCAIPDWDPTSKKPAANYHDGGHTRREVVTYSAIPRSVAHIISYHSPALILYYFLWPQTPKYI